MPSISIERRLQLSIGLSITLFTLIFILLGSYAVRKLSLDYVLTRMEHDAESLLGAIRLDGPAPGEQRHTRPNRITPVYLQPQSGHYYLIRLGQGEIETSRSLWDFPLSQPEAAPGERHVRQIPGPNDQQLLQLTIGYEHRGVPLIISVAEDIAGLESRIARYRQHFILAAFLLVGMLLLLLRYLVRQGFTPMETLRHEVQEVAKGHQQQLEESVPSEVHPLVQELNRLLVLLDSRHTRSRHALGNLAHALKTPLNLASQDLEAADLDAETRQRVKQRLERIHQLTQRELRRASMAGKGSPGQHFKPAEEIPDLLQALRSMYLSKSLHFTTSELPTASLPLDREDMLELLGNLLDNACKWANKQVGIKLEAKPDAFHVQIADDGPGVDESQRYSLSGRGVRIDEQTEGHGLGLAIAQDIVTLYNGQIVLGQDPDLGGLQIRLHLPIATTMPEG